MMIIMGNPSGITKREQRLTVAELDELVRDLASRPAEWITQVRLDSDGRWYQRIQLSDQHEVWLISWLPGQSTGFHDHGGSAGAFAVVWGSLEERNVGSSRVVDAGSARSFGPKYIHDVVNSSAGSVAVSVHAYSPPLSEMTRYTLTPDGLVSSGTESEEDW
jgi:predicted metal-dependent enzyme (double-stranded beta helix superfamily)